MPKTPGDTTSWWAMIYNALSGGYLFTPKTSHFGEMPVVARTPLIEIASVFPISAYRDAVTVAGSGTVTKFNGEYALATTATAGDSAKLQSAERGRYKPGYSANIGVGVRVPIMPTGSQRATWGYFDTQNGLYFGVDATAPFVALLKGSVETLFYQSAWNVDRLDGTGASGLTLDLTKGLIFQLMFSWYGYGVIEYQVIMPDDLGAQRVVTVHRYSPNHTTSIDVPNLPIGAQISNNSSATAFNLYVGGRQFSIIGVYHPNERITCGMTVGKTGITTTPLPVLSFQRNGASTSVYTPCRLIGLDCIASADSIIEVFLNPTLTGASFGAIPNIAAVESALQMDTTATAFSGGNLVYATLISASGSGNNSSGSTVVGGLSLDVPAGQILTITLRTLSGTGTTSFVGRMLEDW